MTIVGNAIPLRTKESFDSEGHQIYTSIYRVQSNDPSENPINVRNASGIPAYGTPYSWNGVTNQYALCQTCETDYEDWERSKLFWLVNIGHTTKWNSRVQSGGGGTALRTEPTAELWKVGGSYATGTRITCINTDNQPVLTSGLELKFFEVPDGYDTVTLEGWSLTLSLPQRAQAVNHCNSQTIWDLTARMVYLAQWQYDQVSQGGSSYFHHRLEFWIKYTGWNEVWPLAGTQEYMGASVPPDKRIVPIIAPNDAGGRQTRFLDENGRVIPDSNIPGSVIIRTTKIITEFDFTALSGSIGLPNPLPGNFV